MIGGAFGIYYGRWFHDRVSSHHGQGDALRFLFHRARPFLAPATAITLRGFSNYCASARHDKLLHEGCWLGHRYITRLQRLYW